MSASTSGNNEGDQDNFVTRSQAFKSLVKWAFTVCDTDKSGHVGKDELYTGVILVHLKIAKYAGAAACFPATRETVDKLFDASDVDKSGTIDEEEFTKIMVLTCGSIASRVGLYFALLLFLAPCAAHALVLFIAHWVGGTSLFQFVVQCIRAPIAMIPMLDKLLDWDTLAEDIIGKVVFFVAFPIVFGAIDSFYQAAAEGEMLQAALLSNKNKKE